MRKLLLFFLLLLVWLLSLAEAGGRSVSVVRQGGTVSLSNCSPTMECECGERKYLAENISKIDDEIVGAWEFLSDLPQTRVDFDNLTNLKDVIKNNKYQSQFESLDQFKTALNNSDNPGKLIGDLVNGAGRHPSWIEVLDIRAKILAKKSHVLEVEGLTKTRNYKGTIMEGFTGCHSNQALSDYVAANGGTYRINGKPIKLQADEVFEGQPIILINGKEYVKTNGLPIVEYSAGKYGGTSTFFPENWNNSKILDEVEYAIANNHGLAPGNNPSEYFGFSRDGKVEIHFYLNNDGTIGSYFPKKR